MTEKNYKDTLSLPRTDFPMKANLTAREPELLKTWDETQLYQRIQESRKGRELFVLHDGPPFANGDVHMGTALNKILKDFVVKSQTMLGKRAPYVPGWDCHGLPIEYKVVKGSRDLSPLEVRKRCDVFARKYVDIQRQQFKRLGVLGDWEHPYLTLDPEYEAEILRAFALFVEKGLVYQSKKPVFWSTGAQTALAEAEVEYQERDDTAVYVKFPITSGDWKDKASIAIWTTTPWTLPANLAIAVDPKELYVVQEFSRNGTSETLLLADKLVPQFCANTKFEPTGEPLASFPGARIDKIKARHPFLDREAIVLTADFVTIDSGTGAVHIAPGHGEDDYNLGRAHQLPILSPVDDHGRLTEEAGLPNLTGKYVFDANADVVNLLRERDNLLGSQNFHHSYPYCWRSKTPIIFRNVEQFFIRIDDLRPRALEAIHKEVRWIPSWGENRIAGTVESRPDWVISRQRSWGVPLPVFYSAEGKPILDGKIIRKLADLVAERGSNVWFELDDADLAKQLGLPSGTTKRNDTIDVWIDSGVSHKAVLQTRPELHPGDVLEPGDVQAAGLELPFRPADMYLEATDQHRGWFQSSLMTSIALNNRAPYKTCVTHGFVVDLDGKKISKSGTYDKPMEAGHFVDRHGADLVRLWASSIDYTDDVPFSEEMFTRLGDTYRRIRNTLRILLGNLFDFESRKQEGERPEFGLLDRWILDRLTNLNQDCRSAYETFEFHKVYHAVNRFCAVDLSSLYIDITKDWMYCDASDSPRRRATQAAMHRIFNTLCRLLAPILTFTAEEAWIQSKAPGSVHLQEFFQGGELAADAENLMGQALYVRTLLGPYVEGQRSQGVIGSSQEACVSLEYSDAAGLLEDWWLLQAELLAQILIVSEVKLAKREGLKIEVTKTPHKKCGRCWRHREHVGKSRSDPDLCERCEKVVASCK